jgi:hypothetical protein
MTLNLNGCSTSAAILKILPNATATLLIAAVLQVAACNATRRPWRGYTARGRGFRVEQRGLGSATFHRGLTARRADASVET